MDYKDYAEVISKELYPHEMAVVKCKALEALGLAIVSAWKDVGFGTKGLEFGDIVIPPSPKYSPYIHVFDSQIEPLTKEDVADLMSEVKQAYSRFGASTGTALSYVRPTADQLEISIVLNRGATL